MPEPAVPHPSLLPLLSFYFDRVYSKHEGPGVLPFYADPVRVGHFAVDPEQLAAGRPAALFKLFVLFATYQARRDVVIEKQQREMGKCEVATLAAAGKIHRSAAASPCEFLKGNAFDFSVFCHPKKDDGQIDCGHLPGTPCHVKDASAIFNRLGDLGKMPTYAWLRFFQGKRLAEELNEVFHLTDSSTERAQLLVQRFLLVFRVGRKLATMFVSALATPALAPGLTPWFPDVDGNELVVVDTNVAQAVDRPRGPRARRTNAARASWIRSQAKLIDLRQFQEGLPRFSPRLVQQALYHFRSKSNRKAHGDPCAKTCSCGVPRICPFAPRNSPEGRAEAPAFGVSTPGRF
ncbi:MAG: hypothetical protein HYY25_08120 [Candidatus Wallbacteria bacterium]|nr:hypothetical protein [Candidatus Wallbacteria bacterium]